MINFLIGAAMFFGLCWVWVGGYLADLVIWIISKLAPDSSNEKNLAYVVAGIFLVAGVVAAATLHQQSADTVGGAIAGVGAYIAVRLPNKIRVKREAKLAKAEDSVQAVQSTKPVDAPVATAQTPVDAPAASAQAPEDAPAATVQSATHDPQAATPTPSITAQAATPAPPQPAALRPMPQEVAPPPASLPVVAATAPQETRSEHYARPDLPDWICPKCNHYNLGSSMFCDECGYERG